VTLPMSITTWRLSRSDLTLSHVVLNSATQGAISLPSTRSRRWERVSVIEIFNMLEIKGNMHAKPSAAASR